MDPMKTCGRCKQPFPRTSEFFLRNCASSDGLHSVCKPCKRAYKKDWKRKLQQCLIDAKSVPCMDCHQSYPYYVMDFDHRIGETKIENVSQMIAKNYGQQQILKEIAKCDVVCSNCHRERTWGQKQ